MARKHPCMQGRGGLSWIRSSWLALSSTQTWGARQGWECPPKSREPPSRRVQREPGAWHEYGAFQVSPPPSQPWQPEPGNEQASPGSFLAGPRRSPGAGIVFAGWPGGAGEGVPPVEGPHLFASLGCPLFPTTLSLPPAALLALPFICSCSHSSQSPRGVQLHCAMQHLQRDKVSLGPLFPLTPSLLGTLWLYCMVKLAAP